MDFGAKLEKCWKLFTPAGLVGPRDYILLSLENSFLRTRDARKSRGCTKKISRPNVYCRKTKAAAGTLHPFVFPHLSHTASHTTAQPNQASGATRAMHQLADDEQFLEWLRWLEEDGNWEAKQGLAVCEQGGAAWREVCACYKAIWSHCD